MRIISKDEIFRMITSNNINIKQNSRYIAFDDEGINTILNCYIFLEEYQDFILKNMAEISKNDLLYNQYYWFTNFKNEYYSFKGYDAGIEQQGFKLLNSIVDQLEGNIDWDIIKKIDGGDI